MRSLASEMRRSNLTKLARLLGAQGDTLRSARAVNRTVADAPTLPAIERYDGVLYGELGYARPAGRCPAPPGSVGSGLQRLARGRRRDRSAP